MVMHSALHRFFYISGFLTAALIFTTILSTIFILLGKVTTPLGIGVIIGVVVLIITSGKIFERLLS